MRVLCVVIGSLGLATLATAQESSPAPAPVPQPSSEVQASLDPAIYSVLPEGKTLPEGTMRIRLPVKFVSGTYGWDKDGKKTDIGATLKAVGGGIVGEYGLNNSLSLQLLVPVVYSNDVGLDGNKFRKSQVYKDKYNTFVDAISAKLQAQGVCASRDACRALIASNYELPSDTNVTLPTGEVLKVKAGTPISQYADSLVVNAARPEAGGTGIGDVQIGALYEVVPTGPLRFSAGGGFRFPTGKFEDVPAAQRSTGRGTLDIGLRTNLDLLPCTGVVLSWQNQVESMLQKGKKKKSSLLDPTQLNDADPTSTDAKAAGSDGKSNAMTYERVGARNLGFVKMAFGLGALTPDLMPFGLSMTYNYDVDGQSRYDGVASSGRPISQSLAETIGISGLAYKIPASLDIERDQPIAGRNITLAQQSITTTLKIYYQF